MAFVNFFKLDILVTDIISFEYTSYVNSCIFQTAFCERKKSHGRTQSQCSLSNHKYKKDCSALGL